MQEKTVRIKNIFSGRLLQLKKLKVKLPDGNFTTREIICHRGAVAIIPILKNNRIVLVKQYRKAVEKELFEIPAGTLERRENPTRCAKRELTEETGYKAKNITKILEFYPAPGYTSEKIQIFKAVNLVKSAPRNEPDEFIKTIIVTKKEIRRLVKNGKIKDAKTLIALSSLKII